MARTAVADTLVTGGRVVDVHAERVRDGWPLAIRDGAVAAAGPDANGMTGPDTEIIDAAGALVTPGLVEPHTHLWRLFVREFARLQVEAGVTTTVVESTEIGYPGGIQAVRTLLDEARRAPGRILLTLSPMIGLDPQREGDLGPARDWLPLLDEERVLGVGEAYWADLLRGHVRARELIAEARRRGLAIEGHGAGAKEPVLAALAELGVGSDHEPTTAAEVEKRLQLGWYAYLRSGVTRQDLPQLAGAWAAREARERLAFCTDSAALEDLVAGRSLNRIVGQAVELGLDLAAAVRMATLVPARRFGLHHRLGSLAPGAAADLAIYEDERLQRPRLVLVAGRRPVPTGPSDLSGLAWRPPADLPLEADAYAPPPPGRHRAMAVSAEAPMVTREAEADAAGALVVVAIDRRQGRRRFKGLLTGLGLHDAAFATTCGSDSIALLVVGDRPETMALAARRVVERGGGMSVCAGGRELAGWSAPILGTLSDGDATVVATETGRVNAELRRLGCLVPDPLATIDFLTSPAIPHLRISPAGYHRLRDGAVLGL